MNDRIPGDPERDLPQVLVSARPDEVGWIALAVTPQGEGVGAPEGTTATLTAFGLDLATLAEDARFSGTAGSVIAFPVAPTATRPGVRRVLLVGVGDGSTAAYRKAGAGLARASKGVEALATPLLDGVPHEAAAAFVQGFLLAPHQPRALGEKSRPAPVGRLLLEVSAPAAALDAVLASARSLARATWLARDLAGTPSNLKNPHWLAQTAVRLARADGLSVEVKDEQTLAREGFGALLAVGGGSATPPRLVTLTYTPDSGGDRHVVLVGKGITFDTGGLQLKPSEAMVPMRTDMTGAAVAFATVLAAARAQLPHRASAVLALAENAIGADSYRPDDILTSWDGRTIQIANTDAEGRLVLADAIGYAVGTLAPDVLIDIATLTGAATLGLGRRHGALFSDDDALAGALVAAGERTGERLWRMPLVADYLPAISSELADLAHIPIEASFGGGSITAALFLREFVSPPGGGARPAWAHLDIAGPARADGDEAEVGKGPTGFGVRVLLEWLASAEPVAD